VLVAVVHPADIQDRDGAKLALALIRHTFLRLRLIWADGGYAGQLLDWVRNLRQRNRLKMEIVKRTDDVEASRFSLDVGSLSAPLAGLGAIVVSARTTNTSRPQVKLSSTLR